MATLHIVDADVHDSRPYYLVVENERGIDRHAINLVVEGTFSGALPNFVFFFVVFFSMYFCVVSLSHLISYLPFVFTIFPCLKPFPTPINHSDEIKSNRFYLVPIRNSQIP